MLEECTNEIYHTVYEQAQFPFEEEIGVFYREAKRSQVPFEIMIQNNNVHEQPIQRTKMDIFIRKNLEAMDG